MPSSRRKQQARITFTPIPSSSPAVQGYNKQIQERAAAVGYGDSSQSSKRRKLQPSVTSNAGDAASQNTTTGAMLPTPEDLVAIQEALSGSQKKSKKQAKQKVLDFGPSNGTVNLDGPTAPNMFTQHRGQKRTRESSSDESDNVSTKRKRSKKQCESFMSPAGKKVSKKSRKQKEPTPPQDSDEDEIVVMSARKTQPKSTPNEESEEDEDEDEVVMPSARKPRRPQRQVLEEEDDSEDELPTNPSTQKSRRKTRQSSVLSSSPPAATAGSDDDLQIIEAPFKQQPNEESEDEDVAPKTPGRRRLQRRKRQLTQQEQEEQDDLDEDMDFIGPSSDVDENRPPRDSQTLKKNARLQALERLKQVRSSQKSGLPDIREDEEEDDEANQQELDEMYDNSEESPEPAPTSSRAMFDADEDDEDFIEEGDDDVLGIPEGVPIAFTRYASMPAKELWKFAIEWMVQKKINPAFNMDDEIYTLTFQKLDDEVSGLVGSKFASSAWTSEFTMALRSRPEIAYNTIDRNTAEHAYRDKCDACNRTGHPATREVQFQGNPYHRQTLEDVEDTSKDDDDSDSNEDSDSDSDSAGETAADRPSYDASGRAIVPANKVWYVGKFCMANARTAHALHHWRYHLYEWVKIWIDGNGYSSVKQLKKRDKMSTKKLRKYANKIVDRMVEEKVTKKLWKEFRGTLDDAVNAKTGRFEGGSP